MAQNYNKLSNDKTKIINGSYITHDIFYHLITYRSERLSGKSQNFFDKHYLRPKINSNYYKSFVFVPNQKNICYLWYQPDVLCLKR